MSEITYHLEVFDGPLDLLLHLISKNKINIYDIPIVEILEQYNQALSEMQEKNLSIACEFVAMSAHLLYIKSKMLLPKYDDIDDEEDPRARLVEMLLEYQRIKEVSGTLNSRAEKGLDMYTKQAENISPDKTYKYSHDRHDLRFAILNMLERAETKIPPKITNFAGIVGREVYSVGKKVSYILKKLLSSKKTRFFDLFEGVKSRSELVATFLAVLELCKTNRITVSDDSESISLRLDGNGENYADTGN
ncbi:MAG: segregation/condensation protein A [Oscillospiraceae bacterium]|nr:segregation/condensation protein A [Oscillospiraceae bacterium]